MDKVIQRRVREGGMQGDSDRGAVQNEHRVHGYMLYDHSHIWHGVYECECISFHSCVCLCDALLL